MKQHRRSDDYISERDFNRRMKSVPSLPEYDSPGDSETDAGYEFKMGLEYVPDETTDEENNLELSEGKDNSVDPQTPAEEEVVPPKEKPIDPKIPKHGIKKIPESAKVISSEQPAPWMDQESNSSTH